MNIQLLHKQSCRRSGPWLIFSHPIVILNIEVLEWLKLYSALFRVGLVLCSGSWLYTRGTHLKYQTDYGINCKWITSSWYSYIMWKLYMCSSCMAANITSPRFSYADPCVMANSRILWSNHFCYNQSCMCSMIIANNVHIIYGIFNIKMQCYAVLF